MEKWLLYISRRGQEIKFYVSCLGKKRKKEAWLKNRILHGLLGILNISILFKKKNPVVEVTTSQGTKELFCTIKKWKSTEGRAGARCQVPSCEAAGGAAAMSWRVLEFCEVQVTRKTVALSIIIYSVLIRNTTWMDYETKEILPNLSI